MEHAPVLALLLVAGTASGQSVLLTGFETDGDFDLTGVSTYCSLAAVQGSTDTPGGGSLWSAEVPATFSGTCLDPAITQGLFFKLPELSPGQQVGLSFRHKVPVDGALSMNIVYVNPATGTLPASEWDLGFPEIGFYDPGTGTWNIFTGSFAVPTIIPWPSDLYLVIRYMAASVNSTSALLDNVEMTTDNTGMWAWANTTEGLVVSPQPAREHITVRGLAASVPLEVYNSDGARISLPVWLNGASTIDVERLAPGLYLLRQGARCSRFIKG